MISITPILKKKKKETAFKSTWKNLKTIKSQKMPLNLKNTEKNKNS